MKWYAKRLLGKAMWFSVGVMALALIEGHAAGQCVEQKLLPSDGTEFDIFGLSVSISGPPGKEIAIVGAPFSDSAYIYRHSGANWVQEQKLLPSNVTLSPNFGQSVSIIGTPGNEVVIIGAWFENDSGSAYIYRFNGVNWVVEQKLIASDGATGDLFGVVSISGDPGNEVAIVGARWDDDNGMDSGSAYIYRFNGVNWVEEQKLMASDGAAGDQFGMKVSISGDPGNEVVIVGAWADDAPLLDSGSAYIYRFDPGLPGWVQEAKLLASDGTASDFYGHSVSISGAPGNEVAIVGSFRDDNNNGTDSGSAYIYRFNGVNWVEEQKLLASDGAEGDAFGVSVLISGDPGNEVAIVGAIWDDDNGTDSGSAYIFRKSGANWVQEQKLLASNGAAEDWFGTVSISGIPGNEVAIVGASRDDDNGQFSGSAYIFELPCGPACPADLNGDRIVDVLDLIRVIHALFTRGDVPEDLDGNGVVTFRDMHIVILNFGSCDDSNPESCPSDLNGDGIVDVPDLLLLLGSWGPCPAPCPPDSNGDGAVNVTDLLAIIAAWGPCP